ncbi:DUF115 domain-containing protein [Gracilibacillus salitolerans]|uniref:DUF115 domain-containing protein n=1 Tax=Gracilibacillus salitolerans TaxID=2663022 RepID=A0A5Q2THB6_9BACI|nr:6-hydroxymethylpterin diphosphokinase MptE-like protein [Gracilibacillus salitolerans]QGH34055.1 DUF115 domain-containing protein [Gracilibacillus salitolerans]
MLINNRNLLRTKNRLLLEQLNQPSTIADEKIVIEPSKVGIPTLKLNVEGKWKYIHSKYDPNKEARRTFEQFELSNDTEHVIIFGVGLGYHIQLFIEAFPSITFTLYEPDLDILAYCLNNYSFEKNNRINTIVHDKTELYNELAKLTDLHGNSIKVLALPSYMQVFKAELDDLYEKMIDILKNKKNHLITNVSFQKQWTINAIKNFSKVLKTPNIFKDVNNLLFAGKPAIIVAAGPSLNEEFDNLRYIKENGLAYIFSVGSSINSLIDEGIYPDAACTYDPKEQNQIVFKKLKDKEIDNIPLIFGSTVGHETIEDYPGQLLHMITSQDTVATELLSGLKNHKIVLDAASIAVVTFQLLVTLGFGKIILVGQNLAFQNKSMYATGIDYHSNFNIDNEELIKVEDVEGNQIFTNQTFNYMRKQLERYTTKVTDQIVYNTTVGGANIKGTTYRRLIDIISADLTKSEVEPNWFRYNSNYDLDYSITKIQALKKKKKDLIKLLNDAKNKINQIESTLIVNADQIEARFQKFDKVFGKIKKNKFYLTFISPMIRVQLEKLAEISRQIKLAKDYQVKTNLVSEHFGNIIVEIESALTFISEELEKLEISIKEVIRTKNDD